VTAWTRAAGILRPAYRMHPPQVLESQEERVHARDWEKVDAGIEYLRSAKNAGRPFFLYVGISAPHPPFTISRRWLDLIPENAVSLPPPDEYDHPVLQYQRVSKNWEHGLSPELVRLVRRIYCAMIAEVDGMAGLLLDAVEEMGLNESTYVIFCSDHGEMAFDHGQFYKMSPFEGSSRVPLIVTGPDVKRGVRTPALASLVDIFPTLMDMAGLKRPGWVDGHSLLPELRGGRNERPDWALLEYHDTSCCTGTFMLRRGDWKYVALPGYEPLLFNLKDDPDETRNLAPVRPETAKEMDRLLRSIVDYDTVDARAKAYDRESFRRWREKERAAGTYEKNMAWIHSGFDRMKAEDAQPWTIADEALIEKWLAQGSGR